MKAGRAILGYAKSLHLGKIEIHFHRRLGSRNQLKDKFDIVDGQFLAGFDYLLCGSDKADGPFDAVFPIPASICPFGPFPRNVQNM